MRGPWNKQAARVFARYFVTSCQDAVTLEAEVVERAFLSHLSGSLVQQYKDLVDPPDDETRTSRVHAARRRTVSLTSISLTLLV